MSTEAQPKKATGKLQAGVLIAVATVVVLMKACSSSDDVTQVAQTGPRPTQQAPVDINTITTRDQDAALVQFSKQLEVFDRKLTNDAKAIEDRFKQIDFSIRTTNQDLNQQIRGISDLIVQQDKDKVTEQYLKMNESARGDSLPTPANPIDIVTSAMPSEKGVTLETFDFGFPDSPFNNASSGTKPSTPAQRQEQHHSYGPNYFILRPETTQTASGVSGGGDVYNQTAAAELAYLSGPSRNSATTQTQQPVPISRPAAAPQPVAPYQSPQPEQEKPATVEYEIPAFSYVEVTTLHGASCPVGGNQPGNVSDSNPQARPIVLPVRGVFRGPNGAERDVGTIHLMGFCSGNRTESSKTGRATIRVERLSYWDASGKAQYLPALGYIVDTRDNQMDVYGRLQKVSGRTLALEAAAASVAAFASALSQSEYATSSSSTGGEVSASQMLVGDATNAALAQGVGALFQKIADRFQAEASAAMDSILVEPGIRLRFVTEQVIKVQQSAPPVEINSNFYNVLI